MKKHIVRFKGILSRPQSVASGTLSIMFFMIVSKCLGFVREMVLAANFGTSWRFDALIVAMDPAMQLGTIISGAIAAMMVPIYIAEKKNEGVERSNEYIAQVLFLSALLLLGFGSLFTLFPEFFVKVFAPNFDGRELEYAIRKMRIIGFLPLIQGFQSILSAVLNSEKKYTLASIIQLGFNVFTIPVIILFSPIFSEASYLFSFIIGTVIVDIFLFLTIRRKITIKGILKTFKNPRIKETFFLAFPLILSGGLSVINNIVDKAFASSLQEGSITALRFAQTIRAMINSLIISSLMTTVFTELSETKISEDHKGVELRLKKSSKDLLNFIVPLVSWLILMAEPLVVFLFQRGNFNSQSSKMVTSAFIGYAFILIISPIYNLILKTLTAYKKTVITFMISCVSIGLNYLFNALLIEKFDVLGLAVSSSLVITITTTILYCYLRKTFGFKFLDKKNTTLISLTNVAVIITFLSLKNIIDPTIWFITVNITGISMMIFFNRQMIKYLFRRMKERSF